MKELNFGKWTILGTLPFQADFSRNLREGGDFPALVPPVNATVPGCVYDDLYKAGVIEDPYFDRNTLACEWVANRWWIYRTDFTVEASDLQKDLILTLNGIDYEGTIYLNGKKVGHHEGMYYPFIAAVNEFVVEGENKLVVVLEHAPDTFGQAGYTSKTRYLKARFNYKWDFAIRLVSLGLYDTVTLKAHEGVYLGDLLVQTKCKADVAYEGCTFGVTATADLNVMRAGSYKAVIKWDGKVVGEQELALEPGKSAVKFTFDVENAKLWWPNGSGAQPLYGFDIEVYAGEALSDSKHKRIGLRTMEHVKPDGREDVLEYQLVVNGKKIYRKGTNMVPLTHLTGALTDEHLKRTMVACKDANINFLRIWGGGHFESEAFYDYADEYGLMIMQEFPESSSGCDDLPSRDEHFLGLLKKAVPGQVKRIASHASFCEFDGGNEMEDFRHADQEDHEGYAATFEDPILAMFRDWIEEAAPGSYMLPSSGSGLNTIYTKGQNERNHDVHGPWKYMGPVEQYTLYNETDCIVHGEFGCGGISSIDSLKNFLSPELIKFTVAREDKVWAHHGSGSWDGYPFTIKPMFGDLSQIPFEDYILVNQYMQYEGLRYSLECHRSKSWRTVGTMTWQFNEPWPNIECSNVFDFYGRKKLGYYGIQEAYEPVTVSLQYKKFFWEVGDTFEARVTAVNDFAAADAALTVSITSMDGEKVYYTEQFNGLAEANKPTAMGVASWFVPVGITGGFVVKVKGYIGDTVIDKQYLQLIADIPADLDEIMKGFPRPKAAGGTPRPKPSCFYGKLGDWKVVADFARSLKETYTDF